MTRLHYVIQRVVVLTVCLTLVITLKDSGSHRVNAQAGNGVVTVTGKVKVKNPFILEDSAEPYMTLIDLTALVKRDREMPLPFPGATITGVQGDLASGAPFHIDLPIEPQGILNDVSNGQGKSRGVMLFSVDFETNSVGSPFRGPNEWYGWPSDLDSLQFDQATGEVTGGYFLVWAPDDQEQFPTDYGSDGRLFGVGAPVSPIPAGWTVVNVDQRPFAFIRQHTVEVPIHESLDANNDLSNLSYTQAFDALVKTLRVRYAFTEYKHIDWDSIVSDIRPQVQQAEQSESKEEFNIALLRFVARFKDGHLAVTLPDQYFNQQTSGGVGIVLDQTDDGTVIAQNVLDNLPAALAGIKSGARILAWNGQDIDTALAGTSLLFAPQSSPHGILLQQLRYITRAPIGTRFSITFQNPGEAARTADLLTVKDSQSFRLSSFNAARQPDDMPIQVRLLESGDGYIKVNTFRGDSILLSHTWEWAINRMKALGVPALIIDMRLNSGGSAFLARYFAGSFYTSPFTLDALFHADAVGHFNFVGQDAVQPAPVQWDGPVAVLIGPACASACEIFAAAMAHDSQHLLVGRYPTAGVEAGVEVWNLPDGLAFQAPTLQIRTPDGKLFLEGVGVVPNVKVPVTIESVLYSQPQDLTSAETALQPLIAAAQATPASSATAMLVPTTAATESATPASSATATLIPTMTATLIPTTAATESATPASSATATLIPTTAATESDTPTPSTTATIAPTTAPTEPRTPVPTLGPFGSFAQPQTQD